MRQEISRLRVSSKRFPSTPPYRHVPSLEMTVAADASLVISMVGAEWRHPTLQIAETTPCTPLVISTVAGQPPIGKPLIVQARGQLRLTWRLYAESPQSGKISLLHGQESITAGDLSAQSIIEAVFIYPPPYRHVPPLEMTVAADASPVISIVGAEWRHPTLQIAETTPCTPLVISMKAQQSGEISFHQ